MKTLVALTVLLQCGSCIGFMLSIPELCNHVTALNCKHNTTGPICGKNGVTYQDRCEFSKAFCKDSTIAVHHLGPCLQQQEKQDMVLSVACPTLLGMNCDVNSDSIAYCASDGQTYTDTCRFEQARCLNNKLFLRHIGHCNKP